MTQLDRELEIYANEFYSKRDLYTGLKLILKVVVEIGGLITVVLAIGQLLSLLSVGLSWVGLALSPVIARNILYAASKAYLNASPEDRKAIRAVARFIHGGFSLEHFSDGIVDSAVSVIPESLHFMHELLQEPFVTEAGKAFLSSVLNNFSENVLENKELDIKTAINNAFLQSILVGLYGYSIKDSPLKPNQEDVNRIKKFLATKKRAGRLYRTFINQQIENYLVARSAEQKRDAMRRMLEVLDEVIQRIKTEA